MNVKDMDGNSLRFIQEHACSMNEPIAQELIRLAQHDLRVRERLLKENRLAPGYNSEMEAVHRENASRLKEIIASIGWPTRSKVGEEASEAAWLIVQHAIGEPAFMKQCYQLIQASGEDVNPKHVAYLHDRICYFEGRPQKYGTQYDDGVLYPVEDKSQLNEWRETVQLPPHPVDSIVEIKPSDHPEDLHQDAGFRTWRKKVGWISTNPLS